MLQRESADSFREGEPPLPEAYPRRELEISRPGYRLFSPRSIGLVALLAGPVGPFILLTLNYWRLGQRAAGWTTIAVGILAVVAITAISFALPDSSPAYLIAIPVALVLSIAAKVLQGRVYDTHLEEGGEPASGGAAAGIALLGIVLYLSLIFGVLLAYDLYLAAR